MPKRKRPEEDPKKQFERFLETAQEHEVDESGKPLKEAFKKLAKGQTLKSIVQKRT